MLMAIPYTVKFGTSPVPRRSRSPAKPWCTAWLWRQARKFEYWEESENWSYADAALRGSSYFKPKVLQFFTGNIGLHHVHHLSARNPNYTLPRAHDENPIFHSVPTLSLWDGIKCVRLKLIDERSGHLVTFAGARRTTS